MATAKPAGKPVSVPTPVQKQPVSAPGVGAAGAPPKGTAGSFFLNGEQVHVNPAGIIDSGPNKGKYPMQVGGAAPAAGMPAPPDPAAQAAADQKAGAQRDAQAYIKDALAQYGLGDMAGWAWGEIAAGKSTAQVLQELRQTPQFKTRFPAIADREQYNLANPGANMPPLSPGDYVSYENAYRQLLRNAGLPQGFMDDPGTVSKLLANDVSVAELTARVDQARAATFDLNPEALSRIQQIYGVGPGSGALTAFMLNPDHAEPLLKRDLLAAQIGGQADRTGYLGLNNTTAQVLAQNGVSEGQAQQGFNSLQHQQPLFNALPGTQEAEIGQGTQIAAMFDQNAEAQRLIDARKNLRLSQFADQGAGGFANTAQGMTGLGQAPR
jgi:hypothetical protein